LGKLVITRRVGERVFIAPLAIISVIASGGGVASIEIRTHLNIILLPDMITLHQPPSSPGRERPPILVTVNVEDTLAFGTDVKVMVVSAKNDVVKFGIEAPPHVQILREEVYERIVRETREAAKATEIIEFTDELRKQIQSTKSKNLSIKNNKATPDDKDPDDKD
jgi:carbon storage regulator